MYKIGYKKIEKFIFTQDDVNTFANISGDKNLLHLDKEYAKQTIFKKPIIHGFLGSSIFSKLLGTSFYGDGTIYLSQNLKFHKPMYVDVQYTANLEITEIDIKKHRAVVETKILDLENNLITSGEALIQNEKIK